MRKIVVGTSKGLVIFAKHDSGWRIVDNHFQGLPVSFVFVEPESKNWWVGIAHRHWGQKIHFSEDQGQSWKPVKMPVYPNDAKLSSGQSATLKKIWVMQSSGKGEDQKLWLGTEPGGLFCKGYNDNEFKLVESLWNHPSRKDENQWFGAGRDFPFIHSIVVDPRDANHIYIAVSCAGVFETCDGGETWAPKNKGLIAAYLPNPEVEVGHDPHLLLCCNYHPEVLWQQNHCGIFRSSDRGESWKLISNEKEGPHYGFAIAIDHLNPERAWVIPATSDEMRIPKNLALSVYRTEDAGATWQKLTKGLPQQNTYDIVFRHSFDISGSTIAFGTSTGNFYLSHDWGDHWNLLTNNLARVECVKFVWE